MTREQAETFTENLSEMVFSSLATKEDIDRLDNKIEVKIDQALNSLTIKLGSLMAIRLGMTSFIIKLSN